MTTTEDLDDPYFRHFHREPLPDAGIRIVLLTELTPERAGSVVAPLADRLGEMGREVETQIIPVVDADLGRALTSGLEGARLPLVLVTTAEEPLTERTSSRSSRRSTTAITSSDAGRPVPARVGSDGSCRSPGGSSSRSRYATSTRPAGSIDSRSSRRRPCSRRPRSWMSRSWPRRRFSGN